MRIGSPTPVRGAQTAPATDLVTVAALAALACILAVALHELCGHGLACYLLGIREIELGAFYVAYDGSQVPELQRRLISLAGPAMSAITGLAAWALLPVLPVRHHYARTLLWLLGTITLLTATGYLLFSGISGVGDFGTTANGALYRARPEWLARTVMSLLGGLTYYAMMKVSVAKLDGILGGGPERVPRAKRLALTSYLTCGIVSVLIGLLNPQGIFVVIMSAASSSFGGNFGLVRMAKMLDPQRVSPAPTELVLERSWIWIATAVVVTAAYTAVFGRTLVL